jgi:hypothetical protein
MPLPPPLPPPLCTPRVTTAPSETTVAEARESPRTKKRTREWCVTNSMFPLHLASPAAVPAPRDVTFDPCSSY